MRDHSPSLTLSAIAGAAIPAVLAAGCLGLYALFDVALAVSSPLIVLLATVLMGSAWVVVWRHLTVLRRSERQIERLGEIAAGLLASPGQANLVNPPPGLVESRVLELAGAWRKALDQIVRLREKLETLRGAVRTTLPDTGEPGPTLGPTHFVVGTSRNRMVARLAPNLNIMATTPPLRQLLGRSSADLQAHSFLEVVHPDETESVRRALLDALKDGEGHDITFRVLPGPNPRSPANERFIQTDVMTCYDETGLPLHLRCHFLDITERVLTERQLLRSTREVTEANARLRKTNEDLQRLKESYRDLYHFAPVLYFSLDANGAFAAFNETMVRVLGYPREALLGKPYASLLAPAARPAFLANPAALHKAGEIETQWVKQDGSIIDVWIGITVIHDINGSFVRSRSAARDITDNKRLANALRTHTEDLRKANDQLRRTNQELEEFTYVVSHDLKEPLRTLEAFSNFLAKDYGPQLGEEGGEYIDHLVQASRRLGRLIDDLLTLSRTGRVINTPRAFAWGPVVDTVLRDLQDLVHRKNAEITIENNLPPVIGDPERVMQLLTNLFSNALKYNLQARPTVTFGHRHEDARCPAGFVTLFVADNGIGIDPAHHEQIFRIFRRLHRRDEFEGTGAGLAICKRIVEAHGGTIRVESIPGQGATFLFTLPRSAGSKTLTNGEVTREKAALVAGGR